MSDGGERIVPERWAQYYLGSAPSLVWLLGVNVFAVLVGVRYYVDTMAGVSTFLWPLYADSPAAVFLMCLSLSTLLPFIGRPLASVPRTRVLAYLHTLTFVWLVKMGLWTFLAITLGFGTVVPARWGALPAVLAAAGIVVTHLGFVAEALLIPHYGSTTRGALAAALALALANDVLDYGYGLSPPLRTEPGVVLTAATVGVSVLSVGLAARQLDRRPAERAG